MTEIEIVRQNLEKALDDTNDVSELKKALQEYADAVQQVKLFGAMKCDFFSRLS